MIRLKTLCKWCNKSYEINLQTDFKYIECCSDQCKHLYFLATGTSFNPFNIDRKEVIRHYNRDLGIKTIKTLIEENKKKIEI